MVESGVEPDQRILECAGRRSNVGATRRVLRPAVWHARARRGSALLQRATGPVASGFTALHLRPPKGVGAWILGRNMFSPSRGAWVDDGWKGWWGDDPPYHTPVFVLTHHARAPIEMKGGTVFHFVTDGITAALDRAREAAAGQDVCVGGRRAGTRFARGADQGLRRSRSGHRPFP